MTLKEWYEFNEPVNRFGDCFIRIGKRDSVSATDAILPDTLMAMQNAITLFGNFELRYISRGYSEQSEYYTIRFHLWTPEES